MKEPLPPEPIQNWTDYRAAWRRMARWERARWLVEMRTDDPPFWLHLRLKGINMLRRLSIFFLAPFFKRYRLKAPPSLDTINSILIAPNVPIGDLLLASPVWRALKKQKPSLRIGIIASNRNKDVLRLDPYVDEVIEIFKGSPIIDWKAVSRVRKQGWEMIYAPAGIFKPTRWAVFSRILVGRRGITATMHHSRVKRYSKIYSICFQRPWQPPPQPMVEQFQSFLEQCFGIEFSIEERKPYMVMDDEAKVSVANRVQALLQATGRTCALHLNLEAKANRWEWGIANSIALVKRLETLRPDVLILMTATPMFYGMVKEIIEQSGLTNAQYFPAKGVHELTALTAAASLLVSPDTSVVHLAITQERPLIALHDFNGEWLPYQAKNARVIFSENKQPVWTIPVGSVLEATLEMLPNATNSISYEVSHSLSHV